MRSVRHFLMFWHSPASVLRPVIAALILAYIGLAGETIHCQYFAASHNQHGDHSSSEPATSPDHTTHCLVAKHGGSAAVDAHASSSLPVLTPTAKIVVNDLSFHVTRLVRLTPSRAPPVL